MSAQQHYGGEGLPLSADRATTPLQREFRSYLDCGILSRGFSRIACTSCGEEKLVAFSCHGRGFCPSCGARRMFDTAAHLLDRVLPSVPVRQWVLSFPGQLRVRLAYERAFFEAARRIVVASLFNHQRQQARKLGVARPLPGAICFVQRFSSSLILWPHLHLVVGQNSIRRSRPSGESRCAQSVALTGCDERCSRGDAERWPARRGQAPITLPISSPVTEGLGPSPVYLTPKD